MEGLDCLGEIFGLGVLGLFLFGFWLCWTQISFTLFLFALVVILGSTVRHITSIIYPPIFSIRPTIILLPTVPNIILFTIGRVSKTIQPTTLPKLNNSTHPIRIHINLINPTPQSPNLNLKQFLHIPNNFHQILKLFHDTTSVIICADRILRIVYDVGRWRWRWGVYGDMRFTVHLGDMMVFVEVVE